MIDPLASFEWSSLYEGYDRACVGYKSDSLHLAYFGSDRPRSDRTLYYHLVECFSAEKRIADLSPVGLLRAMLYWKLYSQHTSESMFKKWSAVGGAFARAAVELSNLYKSLPEKLNRNPNEVVELLTALRRYGLPGMQSATTIPVRSTFMHFLYPSTVPIFDRMVLRAVGVTEEDANKDLGVFRDYLQFAWRLADKYAPTTTSHCESSLRLLDMALWVIRGQTIVA